MGRSAAGPFPWDQHRTRRWEGQNHQTFGLVGWPSDWAVWHTRTTDTRKHTHTRTLVWQARGRSSHALGRVCHPSLQFSAPPASRMPQSNHGSWARIFPSRPPSVFANWEESPSPVSRVVTGRSWRQVCVCQWRRVMTAGLVAELGRARARERTELAVGDGGNGSFAQSNLGLLSVPV